jgi:hypothetical protein
MISRSLTILKIRMDINIRENINLRKDAVNHKDDRALNQPFPVHELNAIEFIDSIKKGAILNI